ncbi:hypothetical protein [Lysobacter gummosus]
MQPSQPSHPPQPSTHRDTNWNQGNERFRSQQQPSCRQSARRLEPDLLA